MKYEYDNCLKAFDMIFKIFHVIRIHYPPQSEHIYEAIEVILFNSERQSLKKCPYIQDIITNIKFDE